MFTDAIREALGAAREAWAATEDEFPSEDPDLKADVLSELDSSITGLEDAMRLAHVEPPE